MPIFFPSCSNSLRAFSHSAFFCSLHFYFLVFPSFLIPVRFWANGSRKTTPSRDGNSHENDEISGLLRTFSPSLLALSIHFPPPRPVSLDPLARVRVSNNWFLTRDRKRGKVRNDGDDVGVVDDDGDAYRPRPDAFPGSSCRVTRSYLFLPTPSSSSFFNRHFSSHLISFESSSNLRRISYKIMLKKAQCHLEFDTKS